MDKYIENDIDSFLDSSLRLFKALEFPFQPNVGCAYYEVTQIVKLAHEQVWFHLATFFRVRIYFTTRIKKRRTFLFIDKTDTKKDEKFLFKNISKDSLKNLLI